MGETLAIVDYGSGNLRSVAKGFERAAYEAGRSVDVVVTGDADRVAQADRIVLPGVGAFAACRAGLDAAPGMVDALESAVRDEGRPFMGICVGMQLLATRGLEFGETPGLGWIAGDVAALPIDEPGLRAPHMGWNEVSSTNTSDVLASAAEGADFYFAHSFSFEVENEEDVAAVCTYGARFAAAVANDNICGVQFHPEKSQAAGVAVLAAFLAWRP